MTEEKSFSSHWPSIYDLSGEVHAAFHAEVQCERDSADIHIRELGTGSLGRMSVKGKPEMPNRT